MTSSVSTSSPVVVGTGFVADYLGARLAVNERTAPNDTAVLVAELDALADYHDTIVDCFGSGRRLLFVGTWRSLFYIGPLWTPGGSGCPHCLVVRTANSAFGPDLTGDELVESSSRDISVSIVGPAALTTVRHYVQAALETNLVTNERIIVVDAAAGTVEPRVLLPDATCPSCGVTETDTMPVFAGSEGLLTKPSPEVLRSAELPAHVVERDYLFAGPGLFKEVRQDLQSPFGACSVELSTRWGRREPAIGRGRSYRSSRTVAVLEGLERYAGLHRGARNAPVRAAYTAVADQALYPPSLGVHPDESYESDGFRYQRFDPETVIDWVWAYSFRSDGRVLVPERSAFWGPRHDGEVSFCFETSNGCALGNSAEEAILHGIRELAERDSFLLTWYRKLALDEVDLDVPELGDLLRKARLFTGFDYRAFHSTMEYGMPSFWLAAENRSDDGPAVFAGAAAHPDPVQAITGGLTELVGIILATRHSYPERRPEGLAMLANPWRMTKMQDHALVGSLPEARDRYAFLLDRERERIPLSSVPRTIRSKDLDLRTDVHAAVSGLLDQGFDVLVVDQTMPELRRNGLHCVRVIVPGLLPMTFGHRNRRTAELPRLTEGIGVPYRSQLAEDEEIGCVPHPFP